MRNFNFFKGNPKVEVINDENSELFEKIFGSPTSEINIKLKDLSQRIRYGEVSPEELEQFIVSVYAKHVDLNDERVVEDIEFVSKFSSGIVAGMNGIFSYYSLIVLTNAIVGALLAKGVSLIVVQIFAITMICLAFGSLFLVPVFVYKKILGIVQPKVRNKMIHDRFKEHMTDLEKLQYSYFNI